MKALLLPSAFLASLLSLSAATENFHQTLPLSAQGSVKLSNINGSVEIVAWDKPEVSIDAVKDGRSDQALQNTQIKIASSENEISIHTEHAKKFLGTKEGCSVKYRLSVPAGAQLRSIESVNGSIKVAGVSGDMKLETVNGAITVSDIQGQAVLETVNGTIQACVTKLPASAKLHMEAVNGSCNLCLPEDSGAKLSAETVNGHVSCQLAISDSVHKKNKLHGTLGNGAAFIELESVNGSITISKH